MRVIGRNKLAQPALAAWAAVASLALWKSIVDVRRELPTADFVDPFTVFNIKGKTYRLITILDYGAQIAFVDRCLTHAEYNKGKWKK